MKSSARIGSHPMHPILVAFPLALWTASVIFNVLGAWTNFYGLHQVAFYMASAGCAGAVLAAIPGVVDLFYAIPQGTKPRSIARTHGLLNAAALALFLVSLWLRPSAMTMTYGAYFTAFAGLAVLSVSGWLGGSLVYDHKVGVNETSGR